MNNKQFLEEAKLFTASHIRPYAGVFDAEQQLPRSLIQQMADNGFLGATVSPEYGGLGLDALTYGQLTEVIGKACASTRSLLTVHASLVAESISRFGTSAQKSYWLPEMVSGRKIGSFALTEPDVGSDAKHVQTTYQTKNDHYVINGKKKWISFADIADFFVVIAAQEGELTAFLVDSKTPGITCTPMKGLLAHRATHIAAIDFEEVVVPLESRLGKEGQGFTYIVNTALDHGRYSIAWAGLALAQEALEAMSKYSVHRTQFGQKLFRHQAIQGLITEAAAGVHAARALCVRAGTMRMEKHMNYIIETIMAKYFTSRLAMKTATDAVQLHGGNGCSPDYPVERLFREAKILEIIEGTTQIHQQAIAIFCVQQYGR